MTVNVAIPLSDRTGGSPVALLGTSDGAAVRLDCEEGEGRLLERSNCMANIVVIVASIHMELLYCIVVIALLY